MSLEPDGRMPSRASGWRAPAAVSVVLQLASVGYLLGRSRNQALTHAEAEASVGPGPNGSPSPSTPPPDLTPVDGTWTFAAITGVPPALLPAGAVPDNRSALVIRLPDLGQDRDVDRGEAQEDIDSPDMAFRRAGAGSGGSG